MAHAKACADDNTHIIRTQSSQSKKVNFLTWPDLTFDSASSTRDLGRRLPSDPNNNSYTLGHLKGGTHTDPLSPSIVINYYSLTKYAK